MIEENIPQYDEYSIAIKVDTNDADCVTETNIISRKNLYKLLPLIEEIKKKTSEAKGYFPNFDFATMDEVYPGFTEDDFEDLNGYCPSCGDQGFHSIESIEIGPKVEWFKLL